MMRHCEAVLLTTVDWAEREDEGFWLAKRCAFWLSYADRYSLREWKAACVLFIAAADEKLLKSAEFVKAKGQWDNALLMEIVDAGLKRNSALKRDV